MFTFFLYAQLSAFWILIVQYDVILDVRQPEEVSEGCIESNKFKHIPLPRIKEFKDSKEQEIQSLKGKKVLVYCRGGVRSMAATES